MGDRVNFGKLEAVINPPDLIDIQTRSYMDFLQQDCDPEERKPQGLQGVFKEVFPIESYDGRYVLDYVNYVLAEAKPNALDALADGQTYAAPLHVTFRLKDGPPRSRRV